MIVENVAHRPPGRLLWGVIVIAWLATSVGAVAIGIAGFLLTRAAWALSECLGQPCPPKGPPPGPEILIVHGVAAVVAFLVASLVAFVPTRRVYGISAGAGGAFLAVLMAAHLQSGGFVSLPVLLQAMVVQPLDALAYAMNQVPDLLITSVIVIASVAARRRVAPTP